MAVIQWNPPLQVDLERETALYRKRFSRTSILVAGIGGAGCAAVEHMRTIGLPDVSFWMLDTDYAVDVERDSILRHQLGGWEPQRHGTSGDKALGYRLALDDRELLKMLLEGFEMAIFVTGLGGGTGTGATPVLSRLSKKLGIVTVHAVTLPMPAEGSLYHYNSEFSVEELRLLSDGIIVAPKAQRDKSKQEVFDTWQHWFFQLARGLSKIANNSERDTSNFGNVERALLGESYVRGWGGKHLVQMVDVIVTGAGGVLHAALTLADVPSVRNSLARAKSMLAYFETPEQTQEDDIASAFLTFCGMSSRHDPRSSAFSAFHRDDREDAVRITLYFI